MLTISESVDLSVDNFMVRILLGWGTLKFASLCHTYMACLPSSVYMRSCINKGDISHFAIQSWISAKNLSFTGSG